ncbi:myb-like protein AA [Danio aesculapii]|uniref:myb-like protein AA n=1 Tax=Danio aesculapii TaxID=1142201 RepID=UPI0024C04A1A|nr:myb-like protein AA [Danio aesculapii]
MHSPMAELNSVSDTHALLESMLQKLRLNNQQTNSGSVTDMQTCSASESAEDSSKTKVYHFGTSLSSKEQDGRSSVWNNWENSWTQQSPNLGSALTPAAKQPAKRITKHSGSSAKPKRPPLIWGENKRFISERSNDVTSSVGNKQLSLGGEIRSNVPPVYQRETFRNPPDLLAPTLTPSSLVLDKTEVRGQWSWAAESEKNIGGGFIEQPEKTTKTSRKKWGEPKRWAQSVKERWRERRRGTQSRQRDDGQTQMQNEAQNNYSSLPTPIDVNNTPAALAKTAEIPQVMISTAPDEDEGPSSPSYLSDSLLAFDTTSNLMEEIFSGTEWAQFLSVNHSTSDQSNEPPKSINQSHEEDWTSKWTHKDTTESHLVITQPSFLNSTSNKSVYNQANTSQISDLNTNPIQSSDIFTNQSQNFKQQNEQSQLYDFNLNELKTTENSHPQPMSTEVSDPSQTGTEGFIPFLDLSCLKPRDRSSITSQGSLSRKREHWTKRRDLFEHTTEDMEHEEEQSSSFMNSQSSNSSSLNSVPDSITENPETAVKKRRMEVTRRVRFAEEVIVITARYLPEYNEDEDEDDDDDDDDEDEDYDDDDDEEEEEEEEEEEVEKEDNNDCLEERSPRPSLPRWIASLRGKSAKYKF